MRVYRLATQEDIPALAQLALDAHQYDPDLPDLAYVAEQDGQIIAAVGVEIGHPGMVVLSGAIMHPEHYRSPFLAFRLQEALEDWLLAGGCTAYVFSISKRNTRMQRWMEKLGAVRYAKQKGSYWYVRTFGPDRDALSEVAS